MSKEDLADGTVSALEHQKLLDEYDELLATHKRALDDWEKSSADWGRIHDAGKWLMAAAVICGVLIGLVVAAWFAPEHILWRIAVISVLLMVAGLITAHRADKLMSSVKS